MTEMFNMSQYEASRPGTSSGDDMSFAAVLYRQSEYGDEEKHTINPVTRYIHRITDWQLDFISNGAKYVEKFDITYPKVLTIKPNYDTFAFEKLYMAVKGKVQGKIRQSSNNEYEEEYNKEATILSKKWFGTSVVCHAKRKKLTSKIQKNRQRTHHSGGYKVCLNGFIKPF